MSIDKRKIPDAYYIRLVELMGREKAEQFLVDCNYNFKDVAMKISWLEFTGNVKKKPGQAILIIAPLLYLFIRIIWIYVIEPLF